jgi:hypothetical protein
VGLPGVRLALMDHPNIARVFDAGTTNSGRPFFVMELVKGVPITRLRRAASFTAPATGTFPARMSRGPARAPERGNPPRS